MILVQGVIQSSIQTPLTELDRSIKDYPDYPTVTFALCSFAVGEEDFSSIKPNYFYRSYGDYSSCNFNTSSFSVPFEELINNQYSSMIATSSNLVRTTIYTVSSQLLETLRASSSNFRYPSYSYWEALSGGKFVAIPNSQLNGNTFYFSGGNSWYDASVNPISARMVIGASNLRRYTTNVIALSPYNNPGDIPNLQLWLDGADASRFEFDYFSSFADVACFFDGTGDSFQTSNTVWSSLEGVNKSFTIECWVYLTGFSSQGNDIIGINNFGSNDSVIFRIMTSGSLRFGAWSGSTYTNTSTSNGVVTTNEWIHVAASKSGNTMRLFVNGILQATQTITSATIPTFNRSLQIGGRSEDDASKFRGYISNLRVVDGISLYNSSFSPLPPTPLPNISGTSLLLFQQSGISKDYSNNNHAITTLGNPVFLDPKVPLSRNWLDKSPNALTASQTNILNQPVYKQSILPSGLSALSFDGARSFMNLTSGVSISGNYISFFVYNRPTGGIISQSIGTTSSTTISPYLHLTNDNVYGGTRYFNTPIGFFGNVGGSGIGAIRKNQTLVFADIDGYGVNYNFTPLTLTWSGAVTNVLMNAVGRYQNTSYHKGEYYEYVQTAANLPNAEMSLVIDKLAYKWWTPNKLPAIQTTNPPSLSITSYAPTFNLGSGRWSNMAALPTEPQDAYTIVVEKSYNNTNFTAITSTSATGSYIYPGYISTGFLPTTADYGSYIRGKVVVKNSVGTVTHYTDVVLLSTYLITPPTLSRTSIWNVTVTGGGWQEIGATVNGIFVLGGYVTQRYYKWEYSTNNVSWSTFGPITTASTVSLSSVYTGVPLFVRVTEYPVTALLEAPI